MSELRRLPSSAVALVAVLLLGLAAGGCATDNARQLIDVPDFQSVLKSDLPVLVDFYKEGCATCMALDPTMNDLGREYAGRAIVARFELMKFHFAVTAPQLKDRYEIAMMPTVILFVKGKEQTRWVMNYTIGDYRKELDKVVGPIPAKGGPLPRP
jgi:thioredoxin 1